MPGARLANNAQERTVITTKQLAKKIGLSASRLQGIAQEMDVPKIGQAYAWTDDMIAALMARLDKMKEAPAGTITPDEAAVLTGISASTIRLAANNGRLKGIQTGTRGFWHFDPEDVKKWAEERGPYHSENFNYPVSKKGADGRRQYRKQKGITGKPEDVSEWPTQVEASTGRAFDPLATIRQARSTGACCWQTGKVVK